CARLDTNRKVPDPRLLPAHAYSRLAASDFEYSHLARRVALRHEVANEIARVAFGLKSHNVILHEQRDQLLMLRQRGYDLRGRERNVQEKPDPVGMASTPQGVRDRDQVIIVDPNEIIILDDFLKFDREVIIDPEIPAEVPTRKLSKIEPIMQYRPQHPIGETVIVFLKLVFSEIGDYVFNVLVFDRTRSQLVLRSDLSAP